MLAVVLLFLLVRSSSGIMVRPNNTLWLAIAALKFTDSVFFEPASISMEPSHDEAGSAHFVLTP